MEGFFLMIVWNSISTKSKIVSFSRYWTHLTFTFLSIYTTQIVPLSSIICSSTTFSLFKNKFCCWVISKRILKYLVSKLASSSHKLKIWSLQSVYFPTPPFIKKWKQNFCEGFDELIEEIDKLINYFSAMSFPFFGLNTSWQSCYDSKM